MEIEVMEQFINSDCLTWKTSSPSTLLFTAHNKYLELHNKSAAVTINKKNLPKCSFCSVIFSNAARESASKLYIKQQRLNKN